jgi:hypothetical protein
MHAMLGLSASDIIAASAMGSNLTSFAISHRMQAIRALNQALARGIHTAEEGNAILATCYVLSTQSVLMEDGLSDFVSFIRGCAQVAQSMGCRRMKFLFHSIVLGDQLSKMEPHLKGAPRVNRAFIDAACASFEALAMLC